MQGYADQLTGRWRIAATNFPMWLTGKKLQPYITYGFMGSDPLRLSDTVSYTNKHGKTKTIEGVDTAVAEGFGWRGNGILKPLRSRWAIAGMRGNTLAIRFERSLLTPAGVDILVRDKAEMPEVAQELAGFHKALGITVREFDSLTWL